MNLVGLYFTAMVFGWAVVFYPALLGAWLWWGMQQATPNLTAYASRSGVHT